MQKLAKTLSNIYTSWWCSIDEDMWVSHMDLTRMLIDMWRFGFDFYTD